MNVHAGKSKFDVRYDDDGGTDLGICRHCVQPHLPFTVGEPVAVPKKGQFYNGRIVAVHDNDRYDVDTADIGLQKKVLGARIRRFDTPELGEGVVIEAKFQGVGKAWYRGKITRVNTDDTFDVAYEDGDKEYGVEAEHIRLAAP